MQVTVKTYYHNPATQEQKEFGVTLDDSDGEKLFPDNWNTWGPSLKYKKLRALADIYVLQYASSRSLRPTENVVDDIATVIRKDLTDVQANNLNDIVIGTS